tara:strand:- start:212 stop:484 length:273 start_codon:yes stop_codon:yes gene_type:complete
MRCENCAYWKPVDKEEVADNVGVGSCKYAVERWVAIDADYTTHDWKTTYTLNAGFENNKLFVEDGSEYHANLLTRKDFGCIEFLNKDEIL